MATTDLDGDGVVDLLLAGEALVVLGGHGDGTFSETDVLEVGSYPNTMVVADLNEDGSPDVALGNNDAEVRVFLSECGP